MASLHPYGKSIAMRTLGGGRIIKKKEEWSPEVLDIAVGGGVAVAGGGLRLRGALFC